MGEGWAWVLGLHNVKEGYVVVFISSKVWPSFFLCPIFNGESVGEIEGN